MLLLEIRLKLLLNNSNKMNRKLFKKMLVIPLVLLIIELTDNAKAFPYVNDRDTKEITDNRLLTDYSDSMQNYLMEFGYLPKSNIETGNLRTEDQLRSAIKNLQKFGGIPETGVLDIATRKLIQQPRCGMPDNAESGDYSASNMRRKRFAIQGSKWDHTDISWRLENHRLNGLDTGQVRRILRDALEVWASNSKLTFRETSSPDADIQVLFASKDHGDSYNFDGPGAVLAHAFYPGSGRGGDAHFDSEEIWELFEGRNDDDERPRGTSLMGVAVHEFGHSLGLAHSSVKGAIMFPWYQGYEQNKNLPEDDRIAIQTIYGSKERKWGINPNRPVYPVTTTTTTTTTTTPRPYYTPDRRPSYDKRREEERRRELERERKRAHERAEAERRQREREEREREYEYQPNYPERPRRPHHHHTTTTTTTTTQQPPHRPVHHPHKHPHHRKPSTCDTSYDAITMIRGEIFVFKDQYLWRVTPEGKVMDGYPHEIRRLWNKLPENLTHVDAVYENKDRKIIFFIGKQYYMFSTHNLDPGYPKYITQLGLPATLNKIDAALVWGHNNRTYFYSGTMYWRFDEEVGRVELDYPRDMSMWRGIGYHIDTAFQYQGKTYFFKGKGYWEFNDYYMRVAHERQKSSAQRWMGCKVRSEYDLPNRRREPLIADGSLDTEYQDEDGATSGSTQTTTTHWSKYTFLIYVVLATTIINKFSFF